ncbi:protein regulator of cytokinesis 1 isoform X1 [Denticeps clupeoides]|uniref:protein regulator of cytokinesis 1 isoform X1 n=2 Tax=Denticeps clupeoides TaxID=299321 RepID=UPI0010A51E47|nr:protein regulator of cytokinesis 1-like isoform X1 [Denticeps clupeoides]
MEHVLTSSETLASALVTGINTAMARLIDIWDSIGIMEESRIERMQTVKKYIEDLLNDMITEEDALRHRIKTNIITSQKQLDDLCLEMQLEPYKLEENLTVLQMEKNLRWRLETLQQEKNDRLKELSNMRQQDEELCTELCATPFYIPTGSLPSCEQLQALKEHIQTLAEEKKSRVKVFSALRQDIKCMMEEMGHDPETSLEKDSVCNDADIFLLTKENIKALQLLLTQLEVKRESLLSTRDKLKDRAMSLWNRLDCPEKDGIGFPVDPQGSISNDISRWQREVQRLEELQKSMLEDVIVKVRQELLLLWDVCKFGPRQKEAFEPHFSDDSYTEELLLLHESELVKVKDCYERNRPLLEALEKWEKNWVLFQDFEKKASDPSRFSNRGGALLRESKERTKVQKMLPKLEEELRSGIDAWEKKQGTAFLVHGQRVMEYIAAQKEEYRLQKDKEKLERMTKKTESTPLKTPTKRTLGMNPGGSVPSKIRKTPSQPQLRTTSSSSSYSSSSASSTYLALPSKPPLSAAKRNKAADINQRTPLQEFNTEKIPSIGITYSDFTVSHLPYPLFSYAFFFFVKVDCTILKANFAFLNLSIILLSAFQTVLGCTECFVVSLCPE